MVRSWLSCSHFTVEWARSMATFPRTGMLHEMSGHGSHLRRTPLVNSANLDYFPTSHSPINVRVLQNYIRILSNCRLHMTPDRDAHRTKDRVARQLLRVGRPHSARMVSSSRQNDSSAIVFGQTGSGFETPVWRRPAHPELWAGHSMEYTAPRSWQ